MLTRNILKRLIKDTNAEIRSKHFTVRYTRYDRKNGRGRTEACVRGTSWVYACLDAAEQTYKTISSPPWDTSRIIPSNLPATIFLIDLPKYFHSNRPFCAEYPKGSGSVYIFLPCQCNTTTQRDAFDFIYSTTIHEVTHVFNFQQRPFGSKHAQHWAWFDEGFSMFMEHHVRWGNPDYFLFVRNWIDHPDMSLMTDRGIYQSVMFVSFLSRLAGYDFLNSVWTDSEEEETPLEAINRLLKEKRGDNFCGVFKEYCLNGHFLLDPQKYLFFPEIYRRFGRRAVSRNFTLNMEKPEGNCDATFLPHLSCRYYRFFCNGFDKLSVEIKASQLIETLHAQLAVMGHMDNHLGEPVNLEKCEQENGSVEYVYRAEMEGIEHFDADHVVLVVSNCGVPQPGEEFPTIQKFDQMNHLTYKISAKGY